MRFAFVLLSLPLLAQSALESRIHLLEDKEEIRTLLVNYGRFLDARDFAAYSRLFAKEGEWVGGFGSAKSPVAIQAFMEKNIGTGPAKSPTYHLLSSFIIDVTGDKATAWSRWGFVVQSPEKRPVIAQGGHYIDSLIRENERWKFLRREAVLDVPDKLPTPPAAK